MFVNTNKQKRSLSYSTMINENDKMRFEDLKLGQILYLVNPFTYSYLEQYRCKMKTMIIMEIDYSSKKIYYKSSLLDDNSLKTTPHYFWGDMVRNPLVRVSYSKKEALDYLEKVQKGKVACFVKEDMKYRENNKYN